MALATENRRSGRRPSRGGGHSFWPEGANATGTGIQLFMRARIGLNGRDRCRGRRRATRATVHRPGALPPVVIPVGGRQARTEALTQPSTCLRPRRRGTLERTAHIAWHAIGGVTRARGRAVGRSRPAEDEGWAGGRLTVRGGAKRARARSRSHACVRQAQACPTGASVQPRPPEIAVGRA